MSRATKGMMLTIGIIVSIAVLFALVKSSSGAVPFFVGVGGMIVFLGLWIEKDADKEAKRYPSAFARAVKLIMLKAEIGWWVLMAGISIEIAVAIGLAIREEHVARNTADRIANNDPLNLPITSVRANAILFVRSTNFYKFSEQKLMMDHFLALSIGNRSSMQKGGPDKLRLPCKYLENFGGADDTEWVIEFGMDPMPGLWGASQNLRSEDSVRSADNWDFFRIEMPMLRAKTEVIRGEMSLTINNRVKHFHIPQQTAECQTGSFADFRLVGSSASNDFNVIITSSP